MPVRPDGMISVPLVGDVMAGGRTPAEVADSIQKGLATYVRDPQVAVIPVSYTHLSSNQANNDLAMIADIATAL